MQLLRLWLVRYPTTNLPTSTVLARAPPLALARRLPLEDEEPRESEDELLMLSLSWPRPQEVGAQPPRSGLRLKVGELSDVVSGALLSMLAMPNPKDKGISGGENAESATGGRPPDCPTCVLLLWSPWGTPATSVVTATTAKCQAAGDFPLWPWGHSHLSRQPLTGGMGRTL